MPRVSGILETSLYVDDLWGAIAFYRDLFGFELFFQESRMTALGVPGGQVLLLFQRGATLEPAPGPGGGFIPPHHGEGNLHLCFAIPFRELAAWEAHLLARGLPIESRLVWAGGGTSLYFRDPEGNSLEVATPGLWPNR
ncbi:MAG: glyoxalase [Acetobacteraceae bacterium]|nr:glyoxalase [Acetobacteraceae bacterium]